MSADSNKASVQSVAHTPGPWDAISHDFGRTKVWEVVAGPKADTVVELSLFSQNAEADAKLIAAAPEMLAVVKRFATIDWMGEAELNMWAKKCQEIMRRVV